MALARAILKDAPIVVLDEATAFADPENEALIQRAFSKLAAGRTVIMIAHRLSTVVGADQIVVLNQGQRAGVGYPCRVAVPKRPVCQDVGRIRAGRELENQCSDRGCRRHEGEARPKCSPHSKKKYFLSDKGVAGVKRGIFWTTLTNLITMAGMGFLFLVMAGFVERLTSGADLPDALPIVGGLLVFFSCCSLPLTGSSITTPTASFTRSAASSVWRLPSACANCRCRFWSS